MEYSRYNVLTSGLNNSSTNLRILLEDPSIKNLKDKSWTSFGNRGTVITRSWYPRPTKASGMEKRAEGSLWVSSNHWFHSASLCWPSASVGITKDVSSPVTQTKQNKVYVCPATIVFNACLPLLCCFPALHQFMFHSEDVNCILTDWRGGSSGLYTDAVNNVRIVGAELEYLVNFLEVQISLECA